MATLAERIAEEIGDTPAEEVVHLVLDECECTQLTELTDKFAKLEKLSAAGCGVETLKGFPSLPNLKRLDLSSNNLSADGELAYLKGCTSLTYLLLCGNPIKDLNFLLPLKEHKSLQKLDLTGCDVGESEDYREKVFEMLDQLLILDGMDKNDVEDEEDSEDDEGEGSEDEDEEDVPDDFDEEEDGEGEDDEEEEEPGSWRDTIKTFRQVDKGVKRKRGDDDDDGEDD